MRAAIVVLLLAGLGAGAWWWRRTHRPPARPPTAVTRPGPVLDGVDAAPADAGPRPNPPAGGALELARGTAPALAYSTLRPGAGRADAALVAIADAAARRAGVPVRFDAALDDAAREIAALASTIGEIPPEPALGYLLHSSGAPDGSCAVHLTSAGAGADDVVAETLTRALAALPGESGAVRVGIGEARADGPYSRSIAIVTARLDADLDGVPTALAPGATWRVALTPGAGWRDLHALALLPDGALHELPLVPHGAGVALAVELPRDAPLGAEVAVDIDGVGPRGPGKLAQLTLWLGAAPPAHATVMVLDAEPADLTIAAAEARATALLAADRARAGLPPLEPDAALAAVARAHSEDMATHGFFGHASPRTGLVGDRLRAAGVRVLSYGENLAKNDNLAEAEASLWDSLGHRANIIEPASTHVGVGVARAPDDSGWLVTQVFARPAPAITAATADALVAIINRARQGRGLGAVRRRAALDAAAAAGAALHTGEPARVTAAVSTALADVVRAPSMIWVATGVDVERFAPPAEALGKASALGVALWQDPGSGAAGVVLVIEQ